MNNRFFIGIIALSASLGFGLQAASNEVSLKKGDKVIYFVNDELGEQEVLAERQQALLNFANEKGEDSLLIVRDPLSLKHLKDCVAEDKWICLQVIENDQKENKQKVQRVGLGSVELSMRNDYTFRVFNMAFEPLLFYPSTTVSYIKLFIETFCGKFEQRPILLERMPGHFAIRRKAISSLRDADEISSATGGQKKILGDMVHDIELMEVFREIELRSNSTFIFCGNKKDIQLLTDLLKADGWDDSALAWFSSSFSSSSSSPAASSVSAETQQTEILLEEQKDQLLGEPDKFLSQDTDSTDSSDKSELVRNTSIGNGTKVVLCAGVVVGLAVAAYNTGFARSLWSMISRVFSS